MADAATTTTTVTWYSGHVPTDGPPDLLRVFGRREDAEHFASHIGEGCSCEHRPEVVAGGNLDTQADDAQSALRDAVYAAHDAYEMERLVSEALPDDDGLAAVIDEGIFVAEQALLDAANLAAWATQEMFDAEDDAA